MKKKNLTALKLNKKQIAHLTKTNIQGGADVIASISTLRFICTNHPKQETDFCGPTASDGCNITQADEFSCWCTVA
jgi:hypothetical protein